ncbi:hypothetical protein QE177_04345 [Arsenophonus sp. aPb]|uniref:hypothetical protein n=1 Tax=Arsenophonus sp. aPb TaxID=3041619 RepID=UPI002468DD97|nr:hypothetical protein [Arsenophonus sp. aPb]WGL99117.1 hypothetical protein QE177_04345 [Arsenophonus sp. aPb]
MNAYYLKDKIENERMDKSDELDFLNEMAVNDANDIYNELPVNLLSDEAAKILEPILRESLKAQNNFENSLKATIEIYLKDKRGLL